MTQNHLPQSMKFYLKYYTFQLLDLPAPSPKIILERVPWRVMINYLTIFDFKK